MHLITLLTLVLSSIAFAVAAETLTILSWPLSAVSPSTLAKVTYTATNASITSYTAPKLSESADSVVRVGFRNKAGEWSGIATSASNFESDKQKTLVLHLNTEGEVYHVGFKAYKQGLSSANGEGKDGVEVQVIPMNEGPKVFLDKPVVVDPQGNVEGNVPEKTFLQKYWWAIAGFIVLQVVLSGGGGKE